LVLFVDSSGCSGEQPLPGTRWGGTHLGKFSVGDAICYPSHLGPTSSFDLLCSVSPRSHLKHSPLCSPSLLLPEWSSPAFQQLSGVMQTCATKAVGWVRRRSDLGSSVDRCAVEWSTCNKLQMLSAEVPT